MGAHGRSLGLLVRGGEQTAHKASVKDPKTLQDVNVTGLAKWSGRQKFPVTPYKFRVEGRVAYGWLSSLQHSTVEHVAMPVHK
jgi:hypothetical protein